ncbi:pentapeptide repeat-containing protein [Streptomyces sp. NBC_00882]|uniref:pentapeptide repeat-containing protein n=1 Tax=Streptomyces sp. NBC_00882 TaxID=2975856 RepID=UPI0038673034
MLRKPHPPPNPDDPDSDLPAEPAADVQAALTALTRTESRTHVAPPALPDLQGLRLAGAQLRQADLTHVNLGAATLTGASLAGARRARSAVRHVPGEHRGAGGRRVGGGATDSYAATMSRSWYAIRSRVRTGWSS